jgi:putative FmdB family regulatory protein
LEETVPTYQYACTACDERLEAVQSFTDAPLTECPVCGGALRKVFSAVGVVFKGSGFYKNDSRGSTTADAKSDGKSDAGAAKAGGGDGGGSGDKAAASTSSASKDSSSSSPAASSTPASKSA